MATTEASAGGALLNKRPGGSATAIPTTYKGVRMRSRLEAKWAAFFDALKWPWAYEPVDLDFYIPDFVLRFPAGPIVVEVKPELEIDALRPHVARVIRSGWPREAIGVGAALFPSPDAPLLGIIADTSCAPTMGAELDRAALFRCLSCGEISVRSESLSWRCRVCGESDGGHLGFVDADEIDRLHAEAANRVQWRGV